MQPGAKFPQIFAPSNPLILTTVVIITIEPLALTGQCGTLSFRRPRALSEITGTAGHSSWVWFEGLILRD